MAEPFVLTGTDTHGVATVTLKRLAVNNACNREMIVGLAPILE